MLKSSIGKILIVIGFLYGNLSAIECCLPSKPTNESDEKEQKALYIPQMPMNYKFLDSCDSYPLECLNKPVVGGAEQERDEKEQKVTYIQQTTIFHDLFNLYAPYPLHCSNKSLIYCVPKKRGLAEDIIVIYDNTHTIYANGEIKPLIGIIKPQSLSTRLLGISPSGNFIVWKNHTSVVIQNENGWNKQFATNPSSNDVVCFSPDETLLIHSVYNIITVWNLAQTIWSDSQAVLEKQASRRFKYGLITDIQVDKHTNKIIGHIPSNDVVALCDISLQQAPKFISYRGISKTMYELRIPKIFPSGKLAIIGSRGSVIMCDLTSETIYFERQKSFPIPHGLSINTLNFFRHYTLAILRKKNEISPHELLVMKNKQIIGRKLFCYTQTTGISPDGEIIYLKGQGFLNKFKTRDILYSIVKGID